MANLEGEIETGHIHHQIATGVRGFVWKNYNPRKGGTLTLGSASLDNPQTFSEPDYPDFTRRYHSATATQHAFLLSDTRLFNTATTFRLDVTNLTNRHYWTNIVPGGLNGYSGAGYASASVGEPRRVEVSMQLSF